MNNIKPFTTSKGEFLAVLLPDDGIVPNMTLNSLKKTILSYWDKSLKDAAHIELPKGKYSIIGLQSEINEEQARKIMMPYFTALQEFNSLIQSIECYTVNPYGEDIPYNAVFDAIDVANLQAKITLWQQAQQNTGNWLILKKNK